MPWRDVLPIHPAADLFPRMSPEELRELGEDIKKCGLNNPIVLWEAEKNAPPLLLDGRNRLGAMEAVGLPVLGKEGKWLDWSIDPYCARPGTDDPRSALGAHVLRFELSDERGETW